MTDNRLLTEQEIKDALGGCGISNINSDADVIVGAIRLAQDEKTRATCNKEWQEKVIKPFIKFLDETAFAYGAHEEMERLMRFMK